MVHIAFFIMASSFQCITYIYANWLTFAYGVHCAYFDLSSKFKVVKLKQLLNLWPNLKYWIHKCGF